MSSNTNTFSPSGRTTLIGSLPVSDCGQALDLINKYTPEIPLWPQLPSNPLEGMMNQFIEGLPGTTENGSTVTFNLEYDEFEVDQLEFYEEYLAFCEAPESVLTSRFAVSQQRAIGIYEMKKAYQNNSNLAAIKGQVTGPFTLLAGITDPNKRLGYYEPTFREMAVKTLAMKASWQAEFLKDLQLQVIIFIDEPALAGLGSSAFISISKDDIAQDLNEVIAAIQQSNGLAGIHVCANTDWNFMFSLDLDILSFDAYGYFDRLITCKEQVHNFMDRGGIMAWGIIPTVDPDIIQAETAESLSTKWEEQAQMLVNPQWDIKSILSQTLITPSCGTGALEYDLAIKVLELTRDVSAILRTKYM